MSRGGSSKRPVLGKAHVEFGRRLRVLRELAGLDLDDLESEGIIGKGHLSDIENGRGRPSEAKLVELVTYLRGDVSSFKLHLAALHKENEHRKQELERRRLNPDHSVLGQSRDQPASPVSDQPQIVVTNGDEDIVLGDVTFPTSHDYLDFNLPLTIEQAEDDFTVDSDWIVSASVSSRTVRATQSGVQTYRWWFTENPSLLVIGRINIGIKTGGEITKVWRLSNLAYGVEVTLEKPLEEGESTHLRYYKVLEAKGHSEPYVQLDGSAGSRGSRMSVRFSNCEPKAVWYWQNIPSRATPTLYSPEFVLTRQPTGDFEKSFKAMSPGLSSGIAWSFPDDLSLSHQSSSRRERR